MIKYATEFNSSSLLAIMSRERSSFTTLVLIFLCVTTCKAKTIQNCHPSSCGHIKNISFPFRLKTDPNNCGHPSYELECDNNIHTILYLNSKRYYVQSISYENYTIRILDPGIRKNQCSSFPVNTLTYDDIPRAYLQPMEYIALYNYFWSLDPPASYIRNLNTPVMFVSCSNQVESSLYVDTAACNTETSSNTSSASLQKYVLLGNQVRVADLDSSCKINNVAWISSAFPIIDNTSFVSILDTLANGFSLHWYGVYCEKYEERGVCYLNNKNVIKYGYSCYFDGNKNVVKCGHSCFFRFPTNFRQAFNCLQELWRVYYIILVAFADLIILTRFLCGLPCFVTLLVYKYRRHHHFSIYDTIEDFLQGQNDLVPIRYKYRDIKKMTNNFKGKLGEGGYGSVFKGKLRSGIFVAVKMMNKSKASGQEFINEVATIGRIHHVNVVRLIGFCIEGSKHALIYEFMPNGSLEKYIFSREESSISLSYEQMFEISIGVAQGINYLHRGCDVQILHFDIKPHNILLDQNFTPKISDFGLAKLYQTDDSIVSLTAARGTMGYMAPELFYKNIGGVSYKADVYSYGMLLMEMAGKRKNLNPFVENLSQIYFPSWVYDQFSEGKEIGMGDASEEEKKMVKKMILVALWCIQMNPVDRPSMNQIVEMLEGDGENLQMPPKPFLYPEESSVEDHGVHTNDNELPLMSGNYMDSTSLDEDEAKDM